jgi:hypothetical protein
MSHFALEKNQAIIVTRTGSSEKLVKIELVEIEPGKVTLECTSGDRVSVYTSEAWDEMQSKRRAGRLRTLNDRPPQRAPYMN